MKSRHKRVMVLSLGTETDVWNAARITAAWGARRDVETVEVLGWDLTHDACALLPGASLVHDLPLSGLRTRCQRHPLAGAIALQGAIAGILAGRSFDVVLNLTYGGLAGHLAPLFTLDPHSVVGPFVDETGQWRASHPAFEYLATWGVDPTLNVFALQDVWSAGSLVRTDEAGILAVDPVADTLVEHGCGAGPIPVLVAPTHASEAWLGFGWEALVSSLAHDGGRPVMLIAPKGEEELVERISDRTGADIARWPLRHTAALIKRCGAVLTSDFATAVLAAQTGVRQVLLRPQGPLPLAGLPGPHILSMSGARRPLHLEAVLTHASWYLLQRNDLETKLQSAGDGLAIHEVGYDSGGCLGATPIHDAEEDAAADTLRAWRQIWRDAWVGLPPARRAVDHILKYSDSNRLARARLDRGPVGQALRQATKRRETAA
ncbi:MAG: hypothetical protein KUG77_03065 [Nannocystaceae bacterium]|nr:hypothetical protein [Nannocystaceae bacterium]